MRAVALVTLATLFVVMVTVEAANAPYKLCDDCMNKNDKCALNGAGCSCMTNDNYPDEASCKAALETRVAAKAAARAKADAERNAMFAKRNADKAVATAKADYNGGKGWAKAYAICCGKGDLCVCRSGACTDGEDVAEGKFFDGWGPCSEEGNKMTRERRAANQQPTAAPAAGSGKTSAASNGIAVTIVSPNTWPLIKPAGTIIPLTLRVQQMSGAQNVNIDNVHCTTTVKPKGSAPPISSPLRDSTIDIIDGTTKEYTLRNWIQIVPDPGFSSFAADVSINCRAQDSSAGATVGPLSFFADTSIGMRFEEETTDEEVTVVPAKSKAKGKSAPARGKAKQKGRRRKRNGSGRTKRHRATGKNGRPCTIVLGGGGEVAPTSGPVSGGKSNSKVPTKKPVMGKNKMKGGRRV